MTAKKTTTAPEANAPTETASQAAQAPAPFQFEAVKAVTLPLFKWEVNKPCFYRFDEAMFEAKPIKKGRGSSSDEAKKQPPTLAHVTNLETGEQGQIILGTVLKDILRDEYENDAYVGKCFRIIKHSIEAGRDYATYSVVEIKPKV